MRALVIGGGGFLGRYVVEQLLERGDHVTAFGRGQYPELVAAGVRQIRGSVCDFLATRRACEGADIVFHVAARTGFCGSWGSFYQVNVLGTRNVVAACYAVGVRQLVYTSSPSVVFDNRPHSGANESLPYPERYESNYSKSKAVAERYVRQVDPFRLATVSLRPHLIWGPRDTQILPRVIARAERGRLVQVGSGRNKVDLTYVEDAARAHLLAGDALIRGRIPGGSVYFISQDEPVQLWPWINGLLARLRVPVTSRRLSLRAARAIGGVAEFTHWLLRLTREPVLTRFLASELALDHYYDITRAKTDFDYRPAYSMQDALEKTIAFAIGSTGSRLAPQIG